MRLGLRLKGMRIPLPRLPGAWLAWLLLPSLSFAVPDAGYLAFGPMFHRNIAWGGQGARWSFAWEMSYWPRTGVVGYDAGLEFDTRKTVRLYAEAEAGFRQDGLALAGLAAGPALQIGPEGIHWGLQGSGWANALVGVDCRFRYLSGSPADLAPGGYLKVATPVHDSRPGWEIE